MHMIIDNLLYCYQLLIEAKLIRNFDGRYIAMFHQIESDADKWNDSRYIISFEGFQNFIRSIQDDGYEIVSPYHILEDNKKKMVVLTFDDVFEGVYYWVYPFLKQRNIPFVIFPTINKLQENGYVSEEMLKEMVNDYWGCYVGAHGISHCNLRKSLKDKSKKEIIEAGDILGKIIGREVDIFAYPYGSIDAVGRRERKIAERRYKYAFGTLQSGITNKVDLSYIPRMNINEQNYRYVLSCAKKKIMKGENDV